jgi:hypothetical protein
VISNGLSRAPGVGRTWRRHGEEGGGRRPATVAPSACLRRGRRRGRSRNSPYLRVRLPIGWAAWPKPEPPYLGRGCRSGRRLGRSRSSSTAGVRWLGGDHGTGHLSRVPCGAGCRQRASRPAPGNERVADRVGDWAEARATPYLRGGCRSGRRLGRSRSSSTRTASTTSPRCGGVSRRTCTGTTTRAPTTPSVACSSPPTGTTAASRRSSRASRRTRGATRATCWTSASGAWSFQGHEQGRRGRGVAAGPTPARAAYRRAHLSALGDDLGRSLPRSERAPRRR